MDGFFTPQRQEKAAAVEVIFHSSETMHEVRDGCVQLAIGASVFLGKGTPWQKYADLYHKVYNEEVWRCLADTGYFVVIQTDAYVDGKVVPRNVHLPAQLMQRGWRLVDVKVWRRRKADWFQVPFSQVFVFAKGPKVTRKRPNEHNPYFQGIWDYPQGKGGALNSYPDALCRLLVEAFTAPGDTVLDPFAGTARLLGVASRMGREAIGYEIDENLRPTIEANIGCIKAGK